MHEISLVQGMIDQLSELAKQHKAQKVIKISMDIGPLSGVVVDSFRFGFDILSAEDDLTKDAELIISTPPATYRCIKCQYSFETPNDKPDCCPNCKDLFLTPEGGDDMILTQVEME